MKTVEEVKVQNEAFLRESGIDVNAHLPLIEPPEEVTPRSATDVAKRAVALSYMIRIAYEYPFEEASAALEALDVFPVLGSKERRILRGEALSEQDLINLSWQAECMQSVAWALGMAELDHTRGCDDDMSDRIPFEEGEAEFIASATLRPVEDILQQVDLLYRMHWYTVNCRITGKTCKLDESIIRERRRALDWIYGVAEDWDEVPMDT